MRAQGRVELKVARIRKGMSQEEVAKMVGVRQQTFARWEQNNFTPSRWEHIRALETILGVPRQVLFPDLFQDYSGREGMRS